MENLKPKDIIAIIQAGFKANVESFTLGDLKISYQDKAVKAENSLMAIDLSESLVVRPESIDTSEAPNPKRSMQMELDDLMLSDPLKYEEKILEGLTE